MIYPLILHHSSKSGIQGEIKPISRNKCDFGKGFYMGTIENQTKALVLSDKFPNPVYYRVNFNIHNIPPDRKKILEGMEWVYFVLYNRGYLEELKDTKFYKNLEEINNNYDVIIGPIADDNMRNAIIDFQEGYLTDTALKKCLQNIDYGYQYVAKTDFACSQIEILEQYEIKKSEDLDSIKDFSVKRRISGQNIYNKIRKENRRDGLYIDELISDIKEKEEKDDKYLR